MKELTREMFEARAGGGGIVPVYREYLADMETPVSVLSRAVDEDVFLLESVASSETGGRYSFLGVNPYATVYEKDGTVFMQTPADGVSFLPDPDILAALRRLFTERNFRVDPNLPPLQGGAIGYLSYDAVRVFEPRVKLTPEVGTPTAAFMLTDSILVFDNVRRTVTVIVNIDAASPACFEYVGRESHGGETCYHCKCEQCGKLFHLHCGELKGLSAHLLEEHGFQINPMRTVFYGLCEACRRNET